MGLGTRKKLMPSKKIDGNSRYSTASEGNCERTSGIEPVKLLSDRYLRDAPGFTLFLPSSSYIDKQGKRKTDSEIQTYNLCKALRSVNEGDICPVRPLEDMFLQVKKK
jgi:hypothetical protein